MIAGCAFLTAGDAAMKLVVANAPTSQAIFLRSALVLLGLTAIYRRNVFTGIGRGASLRLQLLCAVLWGGSVACFVTSLSYLPLGVAVTALYTAPLFVALMAPRMLQEPFDKTTGAAVIVGFIGTVLVVRPTDFENSFYIILPLLGALFAAFRDIALRKLTSHSTTQSILVVSQVVLAAFFLIPTALVWQPLDFQQIAILSIAALCAAFGVGLTVESFRDNKASFVVPFKYSGVLWGFLIGMALWGEVPATPQLIGVVLVISAGVFLSIQSRPSIAPPE